MAARIALEFILTLITGLLLYIFVLVPVHNSIMDFMMGSGLVMSMLNYQVADVAAWIIISAPFLLIIFAALYAYNSIVYRTGG